MHRGGHRRIDLAQDRCVISRRSTDQRERWRAKVPDRGAFPQKFRIGIIGQAIAKLPPTGLFQQRDDAILGRTGRDGGSHDDGVRPRFLAQGSADLFDDIVHRAEGDAAVRRTRRADRDEGNVRAGDCRGHVRAGGQPSLAHRVGNQCIDELLDDRRAACFQHRELFGRYVDADDLVPEFGEAAAGDHADIANTEHRNTHTQATLAGRTGAVWHEFMNEGWICSLIVPAILDREHCCLGDRHAVRAGAGDFGQRGASR